MVKRKKPGLGLQDDDKRNDEGTLPSATNDAPNSVGENTESPASGNQMKNRIHVTRTSTKETVTSSESIELEACSQAVEKTQKILPVQRYSHRAPKRLKKETTLTDASIKKTVSTLKQNAPMQSKTRRSWELWSVDDKNSFFEALCEYGKDFENIQSYITQRSKKKGIPVNMIKNKDQVRHFYYRTWHKISKYLEIGDDVRKQTQEIYGLINYAELRKKIGGCLNEKNRQKLNELVFNGVTTVKYKGKKLRIKTPVCRALKKLNHVLESKEPEVEKLPKDIVVELRPQSNHAWLHVQNLAQNPRVRTKIPLQRRLKSVIEYLQNRWKPYRLKKKEQIMSSLSQSDNSVLCEDPSPTLHLRPQKESLITTLSISAVDTASSSDVCLEKHLKISRESTSDKEAAKKKQGRLKIKLQNDSESGSKGELNAFPKSAEASDVPEASVKDLERSLEDNYNISLLTPPKSVEEAEDYSESVVDEAQKSLDLLSSMYSSVVETESIAKKFPERTAEDSSEKLKSEEKSSVFNGSTLEEMYLNTCQSETLTLGQILGMSAGQSVSSPEPVSATNDKLESSPLNSVPISEDMSSTMAQEVDKNKVKIEDPVKDNKCSWTQDNVGLLTIGELYLMLGRPSKIVLEYEFEFQLASSLTNDSEQRNIVDVSSSNKSQLLELGEVMRKLIQVASSTFVEFKNKQMPMLPIYRNVTHARANSASQPSNKANSRCTTKGSNVRTNVRATKAFGVNAKLLADQSNNTGLVCSLVDESTKSDMCSTTNVVGTICSDGVIPTSDNHVFVVPVGTAPRMVKKPTQESLREEIDKLLPSTRRGCRVRRKPLVVQRPLLPRDGIGTVTRPRPMTLVHLVPSGSQLTAVIPTSCTSVDKTPTIDVRPIQVPLIPQPKTLAGTHLVVTPVSSPNVQTLDHHQNVSTIINAMDKSHVIITSATGALPNMPDAASLSSPISLQKMQISTDIVGIRDELIASSPPQISIPDTPCSSSTEDVSSFIEISMVQDVSGKNMPEARDHVLGFSENSTLSAFSLSSTKSSIEQLSGNLPSSENTPPQSPPSRPFRISSPGPEAQWLNGESGEFSLNTLLNTLDSPCKVLSVSSSSMNLTSENSNSDPITRLAPVVDSQVRCLLEECSVDFITKFEDLADVINSSNNDSKPA